MIISISVPYNLFISFFFITILSSVHSQEGDSAIILDASVNNSELTSTIINSAKNDDENGPKSESIGKPLSSMIEKESDIIPTSPPALSDFSPEPMMISNLYPTSFMPPMGYSASLKMASDRFTLDSLRLMTSQSNDNVLISPIGILMTYASLIRGASDSVQNSLKSMLELTQFPDINAIQMEFGQMLRRYGKSRDQYILNIGTKTILNGKNMNPEFSEAVSAYFNMLASSEDFSDQRTVQKLNEWILRMTNGTGSTYDNLPIKDDPSNVGMLMMNSVYFKGQWMKPFDRTLTRDIPFNNYDGTRSRVKQMSMNFAQFPFAQLYELKMKIIELPYHGNISMIIMMPDEINGLNSVLHSLTEEMMDKYIASLFPTELSLIAIPRFMLKDSRKFDNIRPQIGSFFSDTVGMSKLSSDLIGRPTARQQTSLMVDEEGSSVSAAYESLTGPYPTQNFTLDRPFMFLIRDKTAQINLFAGIVRKMDGY